MVECRCQKVVSYVWEVVGARVRVLGCWAVCECIVIDAV